MPETLSVAIDFSSTVPPFEQLRSQIAHLAASGALAPGSKLPTVRQLAQELGLAANTVARSYRELEGDGIVVTQGRRGTFVNSVSQSTAPDQVAAMAAGFATTARRSGLSLPEAVRLLEDAWPG
jgi:DNA-binding transcriptional regulator YhcF (GntR family)